MRRLMNLRNLIFAGIGTAVIAVGAVQVNANWGSILTAFGVPVTSETPLISQPPSLSIPPVAPLPKENKNK